MTRRFPGEPEQARFAECEEQLADLERRNWRCPTCLRWIPDRKDICLRCQL